MGIDFQEKEFLKTGYDTLEKTNKLARTGLASCALLVVAASEWSPWQPGADGVATAARTSIHYGLDP